MFFCLKDCLLLFCRAENKIEIKKFFSDILYTHDSIDEPLNRDSLKVNSMFKLRILISNYYYLVLALIDLIFIIITLYHYNENNAHNRYGWETNINFNCS